jgi:ABC-type branched-subunit amino acid transport system ATPase component
MMATPRIVNHGFHAAFLPSFLHWDGTTSVLIPQILFGLGAINLARNPDGVLALVAARRRERRRRGEPRAPTRPGPAPAVAPVAGDGEAAPLLVLEAVHAGYGEVEVLHGVDLAVPRGAVVAVLGANGAGKSTLASVVSGLLAPTAGRILFDGRDVTSHPAHARARAGLLLAPESRGIFPSLSVDDNLALWLPSASERDAAYDRFRHLAERRRLPAASLSGGEQQMLTLAPVLVRPPSLLVADEPTLGLAPLVVEELMRVFADLAAEGVTLLLVEEKARDVLAVADTVAFLELGRVRWTGPRGAVDDERLTAAYLGTT